MSKITTKNNFLRTGQILIIGAIIFLHKPAFALSLPHHLYNMTRRLCETAGAPVYGIFFQGPKNIKETYISEVWEQEKIKNRGKLRYKLFAVWRAPGEEAKGIITGITSSVSSLGKACTEFISIFFGD